MIFITLCPVLALHHLKVVGVKSLLHVVLHVALLVAPSDSKLLFRLLFKWKNCAQLVLSQKKTSNTPQKSTLKYFSLKT